MKKVLTSALLLIGISAFSQTTITANPASQTTSTTTLSPKAKAVCKSWYLTKTEVFSDVHQPNDKQKGDLIIFMENGRYRWIYEGVAEGGTWTMDKSGLWINLTSDAGTGKKLKVVESTEASLKLDFKDTDDVHNILYFGLTANTVPTGK